jgi:importin-7
VEVHWKFKNREHAERVASSGFEYILIDEADKVQVRDNMMNAIMQQIGNRKIMKQYIRSLKMICVHDYPDKLPNLFSQIMAHLNNTSSRESVYAGLQGLFALAARFEFELDEDRVPLHQIIKESFSVLGALVSQMMQHKDDSDALHMLHLICKVFYVSN